MNIKLVYKVVTPGWKGYYSSNAQGKWRLDYMTFKRTIPHTGKLLGFSSKEDACEFGRHNNWKVMIGIGFNVKPAPEYLAFWRDWHVYSSYWNDPEQFSKARKYAEGFGGVTLPPNCSVTMTSFIPLSLITNPKRKRWNS
jgi:hypothetical protein